MKKISHITQDGIEKKYCGKCRAFKPLICFSKNKAVWDRLKRLCRDCANKEGAKYRLENPEKAKQYRDSHKTEIAISNKQYENEHKAEVTVWKKKYKDSHKTEIAISGKQYRQTEKGKKVSRKKNQKYRALKFNNKCEDFDAIEVFERDRFVCQRCGQKTRPDYNQYHPLYPNLDHIVPLSRGGEHTKRNTQCLCSLCNITKGANGSGDQLRLFG